ncbi:hypothetical protein PIB30_085861 [Stylosanthes scabra]|uniref:Uncharacterized protein n=1 Tax=Stylosanthes scabra TaxID=79078 RepID=A0ABU6QUE7_9FABA|nr:hypothetical protein [Stylosanthes scabra]
MLGCAIARRDRAAARSRLHHLKGCFQTLFLITLSHNTNLHITLGTHTHFTTPLNCVNITHYSLTNGDNDGAKPLLDYTLVHKGTVPSSSVGRANAKNNDLGPFKF